MSNIAVKLESGVVKVLKQLKDGMMIGRNYCPFYEDVKNTAKYIIAGKDIYNVDSMGKTLKIGEIISWDKESDDIK